MSPIIAIYSTPIQLLFPPTKLLPVKSFIRNILQICVKSTHVLENVSQFSHQLVTCGIDGWASLFPTQSMTSSLVGGALYVGMWWCGTRDPSSQGRNRPHHIRQPHPLHSRTLTSPGNLSTRCVSFRRANFTDSGGEILTWVCQHCQLVCVAH